MLDKHWTSWTSCETSQPHLWFLCLVSTVFTLSLRVLPLLIKLLLTGGIRSVKSGNTWKRPCGSPGSMVCRLEFTSNILFQSYPLKRFLLMKKEVGSDCLGVRKTEAGNLQILECFFKKWRLKPCINDGSLILSCFYKYPLNWRGGLSTRCSICLWGGACGVTVIVLTWNHSWFFKMFSDGICENQSGGVGLCFTSDLLRKKESERATAGHWFLCPHQLAQSPKTEEGYQRGGQKQKRWKPERALGFHRILE